MHIIAIRPEPPGFGTTIARVDVQLTDQIRMFNLRLIEGPRGRRVHAPIAMGANVATFAPSLAEEIVRAAGVALECANAVRNAA